MGFYEVKERGNQRPVVRTSQVSARERKGEDGEEGEVERVEWRGTDRMKSGLEDLDSSPTS